MIYLAQFRFGSRLDETFGEFSFIAEASSQEEAELKLVGLLTEAVQNEEWFPAPCRILLGRMVAMDRIPATGLAFHHRRRALGEFQLDHFLMKYVPAESVQVLYDMDALDWRKMDDFPIPLMFVERDRSISFPTENVPPHLW